MEKVKKAGLKFVIIIEAIKQGGQLLIFSLGFLKLFIVELVKWHYNKTIIRQQLNNKI